MPPRAWEAVSTQGAVPKADTPRGGAAAAKLWKALPGEKLHGG